MFEELNDLNYNFNTILHSDEALSLLIKDRILKNITLFEGRDGLFSLTLNYRGSGKTHTYTIQAGMGFDKALLDIDTIDDSPDFGAIEKQILSNESIMLNQVNNKLRDYDIDATISKHRIEFTPGRHFDCIGALCFFNTHEYRFPEASNINEAITLLHFEIYTALMTLSAIYDCTKLINRDIKTDLVEQLHPKLKPFKPVEADLIKHFKSKTIKKNSNKPFALILEAEQLSHGIIEPTKIH